MKRKAISVKLRWKKLEEYDFMCTCCEEKDISKLEIDHIVPLARGGSNDETNLQVLCARCNSSKGSYQYGEYYHRERRENPESLYGIIAEKVFDGINKRFGNPEIKSLSYEDAMGIEFKEHKKVN